MGFFDGVMSVGKGAKSFGTNLGKGGLGAVKSVAVWRR